MRSFVFVGGRPWNRPIFEAWKKGRPETLHFISDLSDLSAEALARLGPRYVFFLHWSHKVPQPIVDGFECVCFHMTDLPYGRGGSPLQNLIARGHEETRLTAFRMTAAFDAGPVYLKRPLALRGRAQEIYERATSLSLSMAEEIMAKEIKPEDQTGEPTYFKRRKPEESALPAAPSLAGLYDHIRMLDADGYPAAFVDHGPFRIELSQAELTPDGALTAKARFVFREDK